jgi:hypothetical protein
MSETQSREGFPSCRVTHGSVATTDGTWKFVTVNVNATAVEVVVVWVNVVLVDEVLVLDEVVLVEELPVHVEVDVVELIVVLVEVVCVEDDVVTVVVDVQVAVVEVKVTEDDVVDDVCVVLVPVHVLVVVVDDDPAHGTCPGIHPTASPTGSSAGPTAFSAWGGRRSPWPSPALAPGPSTIIRTAKTKAKAASPKHTTMETFWMDQSPPCGAEPPSSRPVDSSTSVFCVALLEVALSPSPSPFVGIDRDVGAAGT